MLVEGITRKRKQAEVPRATARSNVELWRRREREANAVPLVRLSEVKEPLSLPSPVSAVALEAWMEAAGARKKMLSKITRVEERAKLFSAAAEQEKQKEKFCKGHVKGLAARILNKSRGVHTIDNVWLGEGQARYLTCEVTCGAEGD